MNSFSLIIFLVLVGLHQSQSNFNLERFIDWELKDSIACYRTLTLDFLQNLKKVVPKYCVQDGEDEFKSKIKLRDKNDKLITKNGSNKELFIKGKKQAEEIGSKAIIKIHRCLSYDCNKEKHDELNKFINSFKRRSTECGDSEYVSDAITTLKQTCIEEKREKISKNMASLFSGNQDDINKMGGFWM